MSAKRRRPAPPPAIKARPGRRLVAVRDQRGGWTRVGQYGPVAPGTRPAKTPAGRPAPPPIRPAGLAADRSAAPADRVPLAPASSTGPARSALNKTAPTPKRQPKLKPKLKTKPKPKPAPAEPPDPATQRFAARAAAERRARRWRLARRLLIASIPIALAAVVFFSPVCAVREGEIVVEGISGYVDAAAVADVLRPAVGTPLVRINTAGLADRLEAFPAVKQAAVSLAWPTGLRVAITSRPPVATVADGGQWVVLDADAVQIARLDTPPPGTPEVAIPLEASPRTLRTVLDVLESIPATLSGRIAEIGAHTQDTVYFTLADGQRVVWGDGSQAALKAAALEVLLRTEAAEYNVSAPTMPFVRTDPTDRSDASIESSDSPTDEPSDDDEPTTE